MTPPSAFDIYQTEEGYVAVTSDVRRAILAALAQAPRRLPELADVTGKSKPTLSSLHMRELLHQKIVEEVPDPKDARTKWYRLRATKIGSSDVPVEALREAVKKYATASPFAARVGLAAAFDALAAGDAAEPVLRAQAQRLGNHARSLFPAKDIAGLMATFADVANREGILAVQRFDEADHAVTGAVGASLKGVSAGRLAVALAGFLEGVGDALRIKLRADASTSRGRVTLTAKA